ncbi:hypothetical protein FRUB_08090 [Fimbriiglobus ruber]|uniref:Uncharacterized protein n=1 Tax=Fimbriiglobus ruber TaxID=1908690 RepID=A0A225DHG4_9BACT|nr:hypothetical protein FRUB_08090 [Fimbriiglobus ruber]
MKNFETTCLDFVQDASRPSLSRALFAYESRNQMISISSL